MTVLETLITSSLEEFLTSDERATILAEIDRYQSELEAEKQIAGENNTIHSIKGLTKMEAVAVFEPKGRIEIHELPIAVNELLAKAADRRMPDIKRFFPSAATAGPWFYAEYAAGQFITAHADQYKNKANPEHPKLGTIGVQLDEDSTGGQIYIETCGSGQLWTTEDGFEKLVRRANDASEDFRNLPKTRWSSSISPGDAYLIGSQVLHGTLPVTSGRTRKVITWINA